MNDQRFVSILNDVASEHGLRLPVLKRGEEPSSDFLSEWARFLEACVKKGLGLSDSRWMRVTLESDTTPSRFSLEESRLDESDDPDFRVGLQLLVGLLDPAPADET